MNSPAHQPPKTSALQVWRSFVAGYPVIDKDDAERVLEWFEAEMTGYTEFISGPRGAPAGLMIKGHGKDFCDRIKRWMAHWDVSTEDVAYFEEMATIYNYTNAFVKLEWHPGGHRVAAAYFRRRPPVRRVLHYFSEKGIAPDTLKHILWISKVLQKDSIHFVSAAFRPGVGPRHKLYFSQALRPETWAIVVHRILTIMAHLNTNMDARNKFLQFHSLLAPPHKNATLFLSFSFDKLGLHTSFKIDYPDVSLNAIHQLSPPTGQATTFEDLCHRVHAPALSYLGIRLHPNKSPDLKYYADLYG